MKVKAYAKINLGLRILRKREDGYHDIETIFHRINLFDVIEFNASENISIECDNPEIPIDDHNLCIRAARLLQTRFDINEGVHIKLQKNIPIGAGLGGGSSDAAAVLLHLPKFWRCEIKKSELKEIALILGSDVPYFLEEGTAYATGRGEILEYFKLDIPYWIILINPQIHVSTAWAYKNSFIKSTEHQQRLKELLKKYIHFPKKLEKYIKNDFENLIFENYPKIKRLKFSLYDLGADFVQMTGSGSAIYAFFTDEQTVRSVQNLLSKEYKTHLTECNFF